MRRVIVGYVGVFCLCFLSGSAPSFARDDAGTRVRVLTEAQAVAALMASDPRVRALRARIDEVRAREAERVRWPNPGFVYSRESVSEAKDIFVLARQELPITGRRGSFRKPGARPSMRLRRTCGFWWPGYRPTFGKPSPGSSSRRSAK